MPTEWLVDTNVLIDVIQDDPHFAEASTQALEQCANQGILVINPIIYAEIGMVNQCQYDPLSVYFQFY